MKNNVRLNVIGCTENLPESVRQNLQTCIQDTSSNNRLVLTLALSYSSRWEIVNAVKNIITDVNNESVKLDQIDAKLFSKYLGTSEMPDPELLIRTSGEFRISNFLLWQIAYSELYFSEVLWPDFSKEEFYIALLNYQQRERRFGKTSDQLILKK